MHEPWLFIAFFVILVMGAAAVVWFSPAAVLKRKLGAVPLTRVSAAEHGARVRLTGTIAADTLTLRAPFSGRTCAWYSARVEEYRSYGKSGSWHTVIHEVRSTDFVLQEPTGQARIRMLGPKVASTQDHATDSGTFDDATQVEQGFLQRHGSDSTGLLGFNRSLRYREAVLGSGEGVTVLGRAGSGMDAHGLRMLVIEPDPELGLLLSDDPRSLV